MIITRLLSNTTLEGRVFMENKVRGDKLIITLPERVNEANAAQIKEEILDLITRQYPEKTPELDLAELKYISSSGLRSFLSVQKKYGKGKLNLRNVNKDVYGILEMTGFDDIFHVSKALRQCNITGCDIKATSINGRIYSLNGGMMVKVFNHNITLDQVEQEIQMAQKAMACGVPTPISFSAVKCGENFGIIYEEVNGDSLASLLVKNPGNVVSYAKKFADFLKELHETKVAPGTLPSIKDRYRTWLSQAKNTLPQNEWGQLNALVEAMSDLDTFVHGDLSLNNVYLVDGEMLLMDMASCGYGHPTFDLQALYASLVAIEIDNPGYCRTNIGVDEKTCRSFWKSFSKFYFSNENEYESTPEKIAMMNQLLERYYILKERLLDTLHK